MIVLAIARALVVSLNGSGLNLLHMDTAETLSLTQTRSSAQVWQRC